MVARANCSDSIVKTRAAIREQLETCNYQEVVGQLRKKLPLGVFDAK